MRFPLYPDLKEMCQFYHLSQVQLSPTLCCHGYDLGCSSWVGVANPFSVFLPSLHRSTCPLSSRQCDLTLRNVERRSHGTGIRPSSWSMKFSKPMWITKNSTTSFKEEWRELSAFFVGMCLWVSMRFMLVIECFSSLSMTDISCRSSSLFTRWIKPPTWHSNWLWSNLLPLAQSIV